MLDDMKYSRILLLIAVAIVASSCGAPP